MKQKNSNQMAAVKGWVLKRKAVDKEVITVGKAQEKNHNGQPGLCKVRACFGQHHFSIQIWGRVTMADKIR